MPKQCLNVCGNCIRTKKAKARYRIPKRSGYSQSGEDRLVKAIDRYSLELQKDADWRKAQYGSTFFNSGYVDYLDENYVPGKEQKPACKNQFNDFEQRECDYADLERTLLNTPIR